MFKGFVITMMFVVMVVCNVKPVKADNKDMYTKRVEYAEKTMKAKEAEIELYESFGGDENINMTYVGITYDEVNDRYHMLITFRAFDRINVSIMVVSRVAAIDEGVDYGVVYFNGLLGGTFVGSIDNTVWTEYGATINNTLDELWGLC